MYRSWVTRLAPGEITRYIEKYGNQAVRKAVLIGRLAHIWSKCATNPEGIDRKGSMGPRG